MCQSRLQHTVGPHRGNSEENLRKGLFADVEADLREPIGDIEAPSMSSICSRRLFPLRGGKGKAGDGVTEPAEELVQEELLQDAICRHGGRWPAPQGCARGGSRWSERLGVREVLGEQIL